MKIVEIITLKTEIVGVLYPQSIAIGNTLGGCVGKPVDKVHFLIIDDILEVLCKQDCQTSSPAVAPRQGISRSLKQMKTLKSL